MKIVAKVCEDQVGVENSLDLLEIVLHFAADIREKAVAERFNHHRLLRSASQERSGARLGFTRALGIRAKDDPVQFDVLGMLDETQESPAAADLDIVAV